MAHISVNDLQTMAVKTVSDFHNHGTPLSVGLAKQASERGLNSDQIKRSIEATNTLAYLKSVESDRTGEFPLADYDEIMKCASLPDDMQCDTVLAGAKPYSPSIQAVEEHYSKSVQDQGFPACLPEIPELSKSAELKFLVKEASKNKRALEDAEARAFHLTLDLEKAAQELNKNHFAVEGLSLAAKDVQFTKLARLTFGTVDTPVRIDWIEDVKLHRDWKPAMEKAAALSAVLTQAEDTIAEIHYRSGLDKQAGLLTSMAAGVGRAARAVVTAPFKAVGSRIAAGANAVVDNVATKAQTGFASTGLGKSMGVGPATLKDSTIQTMARSKRMVAGATLAAGAGLDAVSFRPHHDSTRGSNGDVWDALN